MKKILILVGVYMLASGIASIVDSYKREKRDKLKEAKESARRNYIETIFVA